MMPQPWPGTVDLTQLSGASRRSFWRRKAIVEAWDAARRGAKLSGRQLRDIDREFLSSLERRGVHVPRSTLYSWRRAYLADGLKGLLDQRARRAAAATDPPFLAYARKL